MFIFSAKKTVVFIKLQFPVCSLLQMVISVQKKSGFFFYRQSLEKFKVRCVRKKILINSRTLFLKIEKNGCFFFVNEPEYFVCNLECKTFDHLIFSCPSLQPSKKYYR